MSSVKKVNLWSLFIAYFAELDLYIRYFEGIKTNLSWILCIYVVILYWPVLFVIMNYIVWVLRFAFLIISDCFSLFNHQTHKLIIIHGAFWKYYNFSNWEIKSQTKLHNWQHCLLSKPSWIATTRKTTIDFW